MSLEQIIYDALENCGRSKGDVAAGMGTPLSTLSRETSLYDLGAKFGASALIPFMRETRTVSPLAYIADQMGYRLVPKVADPDGEDLRHESLQAVNAENDFIQAANNPDVPYPELVQKRNVLAKENDDVLERRSPEFTAGQVVRGGNIVKVQVPQ